MQCRHCSGSPLEASCYATAVVVGQGDVLEQVKIMERRVIPCFSFWCARCQNVSILNDWRGKFPSQAAYIAHSVAALRQFRQYEEGRLFSP